jgi:hypothetical protein
VEANVVLTPAAADVIRCVKEDLGGRRLSLVIGNGCRDSTAPIETFPENPAAATLARDLSALLGSAEAAARTG